MIFTYSFTEKFILELYNSEEKFKIFSILNQLFFQKKNLILNQSIESFDIIYNKYSNKINDSQFIHQFKQRIYNSTSISFKHIPEDQSDIIFIGTNEKINKKNNTSLVTIDNLQKYNFDDDEELKNKIFKLHFWSKTNNQSNNNDYKKLFDCFKSIAKHCDTIHIIDQHFGKEYWEAIVDPEKKHKRDVQKYPDEWKSTFSFYSKISKDRLINFITYTTGPRKPEDFAKHGKEKYPNEFSFFRDKIREIVEITKNSKFKFYKYDKDLFYERRIITTYKSNLNKSDIVFISRPFNFSTKFMASGNRRLAFEDLEIRDEINDKLNRLEQTAPIYKI